MIKRISLLTCVWVLTFSSGAQSTDRNLANQAQAMSSTKTVTQKMNFMKIRMTVNGKTITGTLIDSPTSRGFFSQLPLTLKLDDYAATEKISYLPRKLSSKGAPAGIDPSIGDITYYAPWGNLAIFYKDFGYSSGLIKLGRIDSGLELLNVPGSLEVVIEGSEN